MADLNKIPDGLYKVKNGWRIFNRSGWISKKTDKDGTLSFMWTSHRKFHSPFLVMHLLLMHHWMAN